MPAITIARNNIAAGGVEGIYHCISRCVRRAFLWGEDYYSCKSYEHRKEWTGRQVRDGKRTAIPDNLAPILERLKINTDNWLDTANVFGRLFKRPAGSFQAMTATAKSLGLRWLRGCRAGREAFSPV